MVRWLCTAPQVAFNGQRGAGAIAKAKGPLWFCICMFGLVLWWTSVFFFPFFYCSHYFNIRPFPPSTMAPGCVFSSITIVTDKNNFRRNDHIVMNGGETWQYKRAKQFWIKCAPFRAAHNSFTKKKGKRWTRPCVWYESFLIYWHTGKLASLFKSRLYAKSMTAKEACEMCTW